MLLDIFHYPTYPQNDTYTELLVSSQKTKHGVGCSFCLGTMPTEDAEEPHQQGATFIGVGACDIGDMYIYFFHRVVVVVRLSY